MIGRLIVLDGPQRIAKLTPITPHTDVEAYPPGTGVFQIQLLVPLPFRLPAIIGPGQKWLGGYSG